MSSSAPSVARTQDAGRGGDDEESAPDNATQRRTLDLEGQGQSNATGMDHTVEAGGTIRLHLLIVTVYTVMEE